MQRDYGLERHLLPGSISDATFKDVVTFINKYPSAKQVDLVTISAYVAGKSYVYKINGVTRSYVATVADADESGVAESIAAKINKDPIFSGLVIASSDAAVITVTARIAGKGFTLAGGSGFTVVHSAANGTADVIPFGSLVLSNGQNASGDTRYCRICKSDNLTAREVVLVPTMVVGADHYVSVMVKDVEYKATYNPTEYEDEADLCAGLAAILTNLIPENTVEASENASKLVLESAVPGLTFGYGVGVSDAAGAWGVESDNTGVFTDINKAAKGIALLSQAVEVNDPDAPGYVGNSAVSVLRKGRVVVSTENEISPDHPVYVRVADTLLTGFRLGGFRSTPATDCIELDSSKFEWSKKLSSDTAELQLL